MTAENIGNLTREFPNLEWQDTSWHNDMTDSITFTVSKTKTVQVWLPNSIIDNYDNEEINYYFFIADDQYGDPIRMDEDGITCKTYIDLLAELRPFLTRNYGRSFDLNRPLLVDGHPTRLREFIRVNRVDNDVEHIEKSQVVSVIQLKAGEKLYTGHISSFEIEALQGSAMLIEHLARAFAKELTSWLGEEKMLEIIWLNAAEEDRNACHTHDFCDANQALIDVFEREGLDAVAETDLSNSVWDLAKANSFYQPVNV